MGSAATGILGSIIYGACKIITKDDLLVAKNDIEKFTEKRFGTKDNHEAPKRY